MWVEGIWFCFALSPVVVQSCYQLGIVMKVGYNEVSLTEIIEMYQKFYKKIMLLLFSFSCQFQNEQSIKSYIEELFPDQVQSITTIKERL